MLLALHSHRHRRQKLYSSSSCECIFVSLSYNSIAMITCSLGRFGVDTVLCCRGAAEASLQSHLLVLLIGHKVIIHSQGGDSTTL